MKVVVVGTGYVGLVSGVCLAEVGHEVVCVDTDHRKIDNLRRGQLPIFEPGLEGLVKSNVEHERLIFTTSLSEALPGARCAFIAVGTPQGEDGSADLRYVKAVAQEIGKLANSELMVIVKSTVPVGSCDVVEGVIAAELKKRGVNFTVSVASNPEFLKEGAAIDDFMKPDRIIVGLMPTADAKAQKVFGELYRPFVMDDPGKLFFMDRRSSELTKYGANAMLATRISFMNEMAQLCERVGANIDNVRIGIGADARIGKKFLYAGPGFGGSCFPKDVSALLRTGEDRGLRLAVLHAVVEANERQKQFVAEKVVKYFKGQIQGKKIVIWGLAFKPGTDDVREAPARTIIEYLLHNGASVVAHDPEAVENFTREIGPVAGLSYSSSSYDALKDADALVLVTEWREYKRPNWNKAAGLMKQKVVFDFRNQYDENALKEAGFYYECVGRPGLIGSTSTTA